MNNIVVLKVKDNEFRIFDPLKRIRLMPKINWLCSMDILNALPEDNQQHDLVKYLKGIRNNYIDDSFTLKQIDSVINFV